MKLNPLKLTTTVNTYMCASNSQYALVNVFHRVTFTSQQA